MSWQQWLGRLKENGTRQRRRSDGATPQRRAKLRPGVELLEDRTVPAVLSTFLTTEHVDLNVGYTGGASGVWSIQPRNNDEFPAVSYAPDEAPPLRRQTGPDLPSIRAAFDFIGVAAGADFYQLPQSQDPNLLYLGGAAGGLNPDDFDRYDPAAESKDRVSGLGRWLKLSLVGVQHFSPNGQPGTGASPCGRATTPAPTSSWPATTTASPIPTATAWTRPTASVPTTPSGSSPAATSTSTGASPHKGRYEVTVKASGYLDDGNTTSLGQLIESPPITLYFSVGSVGQLEFDAASYSVNENAGTASVNVRRVGGSDGRITSTRLPPRRARPRPAPITPTSAAPLTFNDQETEKTVTIPIVNDAAIEADETVNLALSNPGLDHRGRSRSVPVKKIRPPRSSFVIASSAVNVEPSFRSAGSLSRWPMIRLSPVLAARTSPSW